MKYMNIVKAKFVDRPNRFIAHVEIDGKIETVHVKNTGRCREILIPGADVYLEKSDNPSRSTAYDLVAAVKNKRVINIDSQAPNKIVKEWLLSKSYFPNLIKVCPEYTYGNSRFDFYVETEEEKIFIEVKGVTREQGDIVCFPDAPSDRAIKHLQELIAAKEAGYRAIVLFAIQMENVIFFAPDLERHPLFAKTLQKAAEVGVEILAFECDTKVDALCIQKPVPVNLEGVDFSK